MKTRCYACRRIRLKCDGARPACGRCTANQRECPGYPDPVFRSMNEASRRRALRLKRPNGHCCGPPQGSSAVSAPISMSRNWEQEAVCYFFSRFVVPSPNPALSEGCLCFLPEMYRSSCDHLQLRECVSAVSLYLYGRRARMPDLIYRAGEVYGNALRLTARILQDAAAVKSDQTLAAIFLLSLYEIMASEEPSSQLPHNDAQERLVDAGGPFYCRSSAGQNLCRMVRTRQQMSLLTLQLAPRAYSTAEIETLFPSRAASHLFILLLKVGNISSEISNLTTAEVVDHDRMADVLQTALHLNDDLLSWQSMAWSHPDYGIASSRPYSTRRGGPAHAYTFHSLLYSVFWLRLWNGRLHLLQAISDALRACPSLSYIYPKGSAGLSHSRRTVVDDLSAIVPYLLGEFASEETRGRRDGAPAVEDVLVTWTLNLVGQASLLDPDRMDWVLECLTRVGIKHGVRKALVLKQSLQGRVLSAGRIYGAG
ncbi:hypothetical protein VTN77DRAFT_5886 [Rasamsonia byssochlamydoides]|uniref:uncharacterized protein n=1 Tax=Rasamsonia byssochlamydoides TaxID=89139 RepID=UPI0037428F8D